MDLFEEGVDVAVQEPLPEACIRTKERLLKGGFEDVKSLDETTVNSESRRSRGDPRRIGRGESADAACFMTETVLALENYARGVALRRWSIKMVLRCRSIRKTAC